LRPTEALQKIIVSNVVKNIQVMILKNMSLIRKFQNVKNVKG